MKARLVPVAVVVLACAFAALFVLRPGVPEHPLAARASGAGAGVGVIAASNASDVAQHGLAVRALSALVPGQAPEVGTAAPKVSGGTEGKVREIDWLELMPPEDLKKLQEIPPVDHTGMITAEQFMTFNTVAEFDDTRGRMAGYIVPIDANDEGELTEFFLVPYFGACIHVPPPPPNQIVYGKLAKPVPMPDMYAPYWVEGTIKIERTDNELGASAYTMIVDQVTLWEG